jgi:peptidoglycan/LPS O-acetylase OafA/YrhL
MGVEGMPQLSWMIALVLGTGLVILISQVAPNPPLPGIVNRAIVGLALMTYPIYLLHFDFGSGVIRLVREFGANGGIAVLGGFVALMTVSWVVTFQMEPRIRSWVKSCLNW